MVTIERLRELFTLTDDGRLLWKEGNGKGRVAGHEPGSISKDGYRLIWADGASFLAHRAIFAILIGRWPTIVDHINGIKTDNRPCNLRECTRAQNKWNGRTGPRSKTGAIGVTYVPSRVKFQSRITINGEILELGEYDSLSEAAEAYKKAAKRHHGPFLYRAIDGSLNEGV